LLRDVWLSSSPWRWWLIEEAWSLRRLLEQGSSRGARCWTLHNSPLVWHLAWKRWAHLLHLE
jgi:hypothetical protein